MIQDIPTAIDEFYNLLNAAQPTDAPDKLVRAASIMPNDIAVTALARLLTLIHARERYNQARIAAGNPPSQMGLTPYRRGDPSKPLRPAPPVPPPPNKSR